ncbi:hypothetical protein ON010_g7567 [Phytophthora cinnamomi]|nr:hypothetical protein ON010_g7567 [Phytophthora cinnamomi]
MALSFRSLDGTKKEQPIQQPGQGKRRVAKATYGAAHEIRMLRAEVLSLEEELRSLQMKWIKHLPDQRTLFTAQFSAHEKYKADQSTTLHNALKDVHLEQQFMFATLQSAMFRSPLFSRGEEILRTMHFDTQLGSDLEERDAALLVHKERSLAILPSFMDQITRQAIDKTRTYQRNSRNVLPISHIDVTGCKDSTLVTSVFMSEIPHTSLEEVYAAVLAYFDSISASLRRHFGVQASRARLNSAESPIAYWRLSANGVGFSPTVNHVMYTNLTPSLGVVHLDAITGDPLYPTGRSGFDVCGLTITPRKDSATGRTISVTLRWVVLYRYNMLPDDPALQKSLEVVRPILNGDLITASVCGYIQQLLQQRYTP